MPFKRIYAHWLDPELMSHRFPSDLTLDERFNEFQNLLKMHALLGYSVCLSDVQLIDSYTILRLFASPEFKQFLWADPFLRDSDLTFLRVVSRACDWNELGTPKLRVVANGLARALEPSWESSTFPTVEATKSVANILRKETISDQHQARELFERGGRIEAFRQGINDTLLRGMLDALQYFVYFPDSIEESPAPQTKSYYDILKESLAKSESRAKSENYHDLSDQLKSTLLYVDKLSNKYQRGPAVLKLANEGLQDKDNRIRYLHILQAWNFGVSGSVAANLDSGTGLEIPSIGRLHGQTDHWTLPLNVFGTKEPFASFFATKWHPAMTPWSEIGGLRKHCEIEIRAFQAAIGTDRAWDSFTKLVAKIADKEASRQRFFPHFPTAVQIAEVIRTAGPIAVCIMGLTGGAAIAGFIDPKTVNVILASAGGVVAPVKVHDFLVGRKSKRFAEDIEGWARKYNLYREPVSRS